VRDEREIRGEKMMYLLVVANAQCAPTYNTDYGFPDGAQHQIFTNSPPPPAGSHGDTLSSISSPQGPSSLTSTSSIVTPSHESQLVVQGDGNVVFSYIGNGNKTIWATNTAGKGIRKKKKRRLRAVFEAF